MRTFPAQLQAFLDNPGETQLGSDHRGLLRVDFVFKVRNWRAVNPVLSESG